MADGQPTSVVENWKPVVGYEGLYEVSDAGRVRSLDRMVTFAVSEYERSRGYVRTVPVKGRFLRQWMQGRYPVVALSDQPHRKSRYFAVHILVATAFHGLCPEHKECCHANDNPLDNRASNLRWDTRSANIRDRLKNGWLPNKPRLTKAQVSKAREMHRCGVTKLRIAKILGCCRSVASRAIHGEGVYANQ